MLMQPIRVLHFSHGTGTFYIYMRLICAKPAHIRVIYREYCSVLSMSSPTHKAAHSFWDWTLDWQSIFSSPVWDPDHGFGGNGNQSEEASLNYGRCVTDGPFTSLQLSFADPDARNHCLSRGFQDSNFHNFSSHNLRPQVIEQILQTSKYDLFVKAVEEGPHDIIPNMVRGDFWLLTAPNGTSSLAIRVTGHC